MVKRFFRRAQVALAVGVSAATFASCGGAVTLDNAPLACASALCAMLSMVCLLTCE